MILIIAVLSVVLTALFKPIISDRKTWLYSNDILNHKNWISKPDCEGLEFPEGDTWDYQTNKEIHVKSVTLPKNGEIYLDSGFSMQFDETSQEEINCVKLKPIRDQSWLNFNGWNSTDEPDNPAVPYVYRIPTTYDDVVVPDGSLADINLDGARFKSLIYGSKKISKENAYFIDEIADLDLDAEYRITNEECTDPTGCVQTLTNTQVSILCGSIYEEKHFLNCNKPLEFFEFCFVPRCGGLIKILKYRPGFSLDKIRQTLKQYQSYSYAYKPLNKFNEIHIFFTEKEFTGDSIVDATEFYNLIKSDDSYYCSEVILELSGPSLQEKATLIKNMFSSIFGPLLFVLFIFGLLFLMFSPATERVNIRNRFLGSRPLSTFRMRYNNIDETASVVDEQSLAGSTVNLRTAFENPMYDRASTSRSTSDETIASVQQENKTITEIDAELQKSEDINCEPLVEDLTDDKEDLLLKEL